MSRVFWKYNEIGNWYGKIVTEFLITNSVYHTRKGDSTKMCNVYDVTYSYILKTEESCWILLELATQLS